MLRLKKLKQEAFIQPAYPLGMADILYAEGLAAHYDDPAPVDRAYGIAGMFTGAVRHVYKNDRIAGSARGMYACEVAPEAAKRAERIIRSYGMRHFVTNADHFAPDYEGFLKDGVDGTIRKIRASMEKHRQDADAEEKLNFLKAAEICMAAFSQMIEGYADEAEKTAELEGADRNELLEMARVCRKVAHEPPETFREALQLVWITHVAFLWEKRYAMAFGRMDQYLYPYYREDVRCGRMTREEARSLIGCALVKIGEAGRGDVCNIAIGGVRPEDGRSAVNELSYILLDAVGDCGIPGPNLSARISRETPEEFLDACLRLIGTGIGYPALMNDEVNIPAMLRNGYDLADCRNYCMVGCIENFIPGKQPPWSDGRYNSPKYIELALNDGKCMQTGLQLGPRTGAAEEIGSMDELMERLHIQMKAGAAEYMAFFRNENDRYNRKRYDQPFLSCFCRDCIGRAKDINDGGALYPSVHGAGCMGIGTMADSLAAAEQVVFVDKKASLARLRDALKADFEGYEELHRALLRAPKYGNNDDFVDKYAVWFVDEHARLFDEYKTPDGGAIYTAIASNVSNIPAGLEVAATPDGRRNGEPLSDAASPMHGMDKSGPTAVVLSTSKPDYTKVSCGTVLNQKYSPSMFSDADKRAKLRALIRVYFERGGQEMQINSISRDMLMDAMEHPEKYGSLVVRVSGFSDYYTRLSKAVQKDILQRTEQG